MNSSIWERFTKRARVTFNYAQQESKRFDHLYIGSEHLLIGLLREEDGVAGRVLRALGLRTDRVRTVVERYTGGKTTLGNSQNTELDPSTKRILQYALEEAKRMDQHYVSTEHLLLGLVRQNDGMAVKVLRKFGVTPEQVRRQTRRMLKDRDTPSESTTSRRRPRAKKTRRPDPRPYIKGEIIVHPGSAVIVPMIEDNVVMIWQKRPILDMPLLELPAGTRKPSENSLMCAQRELREETGYRAELLVKLGEILPAPGSSTELMDIYLATGLTHDPLPKDADEQIENALMPLADLVEMALTGQLIDAKSIAGIMLANRYHTTMKSK